ncbi:ribosomal-protein-alanine N-acetyltransferase [Acetitomaculum ruminis DSM 5522]|uniref:[Ribosomal protein bS18]-alanine N-acetyltransferase n=1 Tax=Acetitomaculum ruminis DSM 5522 TaxID=1120918 RepID=A0A1I0Z8L5_9FIRM|nr:ribosomal protein S18-alanine N-acetyltransferase [Acetitomaculum ruminis]SFB21456.1 ribosomal-protein-alanine N-acetyltransferase [Acetitomaculum ruminis DSM 5522]
MEFYVDRMTKEDIVYVAQIEKECFSTPWSMDALNDSLKRNDTVFFAARCDGKVVGYCGAYISFEEADITNVAVLKDYRRKNIAMSILQVLFEYCRELGVTGIYLEVRISNEGAVALYEKAGFKNCGIRKNFYDKPREDAIIMRKEID